MQPLVRGDRHLGTVLPVFIPSSFIEGAGWPGPHELIAAPGLALAWGALVDNTIRYVLHEAQQEWEQQGIDWKVRALQNLHELSPDPMGTGALFRDNGDTWLISLMQADGLGPSRLLLTERLERLFPRGYRVALPERNRAFAFTSDLDQEDADTIDNLIQRSYANAERPLVRGIFEPSDLLIATPSSTR